MRSDKGKSRSNYDNSLRRSRAEAKNLARTLEDIERFEEREKEKPRLLRRREQKLLERREKYNSEYKKEKRHQQRRNELPVNRMCPRCNSGPFIKSKQFAKLINKVICRKCFYNITSVIRNYKEFKTFEELEKYYVGICGSNRN